MKNFLIASLVVLSSLHSSEEACCGTANNVRVAGCSDQFSDNFVEAKFAYFYPLSKPLRKIYPGNGQYGLEVNTQLYDMFYAWGQASYFTSSGHDAANNFTRLTLVPCSAGLKFMYNRYRFQPYVGVGALFTYVHMYTDSEILIKKLRKWSAGGIFEFGIVHKVTNNFLIDFFVDYSIQNVIFDPNRYRNVIMTLIDLTAVSCGAGLGYRF